MSMVVAFDTLKYFNTMKNAGFTTEQAEAQTEALVGVMSELVVETLATKKDIDELSLATKQDIHELSLATKQDIDELRLATKQDIDELRLATKQDIDELKQSTTKDISELRQGLVMLENKLTLRLGGIMSAGIVIMSILMAILHHG